MLLRRKRTAIRLSTGERVFQVINITLLVLFAITTVYPFLYFIACSFNDGNDLMRGGVYLFPRVFTLENYKVAFQNKNIVTGFSISIFRTVVGTFLSVIITALVGYALTFKDMPGKTFLILFVYFPGFIGGGGTIPTYILYRNLHLMNNIWVYVVPSLFNMWNAILFRTYFNTIPGGLREAATVDGCSEFRIFWQIMLPLSMPILATIALFNGVGHWNDWFAGAFYVTKDNLRPAATILQQLLTEVSAVTNKTQELENMVVGVDKIVAQNSVTPDSLRMTFVVIITVPIMCVYPFLQKYFMKGVLIGAVKG